MNPEDYRKHVEEFATYEKQPYPVYPLALLVEETDELYEHVELGSPLEKLWYECGDVLWSLFALEADLKGVFLSPIRNVWFRRNTTFSDSSYTSKFWREATLRAKVMNRCSCKTIGKLHKMLRRDPDVQIDCIELMHLIHNFIGFVGLFPITFSEIAMMNREKLVDRRERDTLHGNGDDR